MVWSNQLLLLLKNAVSVYGDGDPKCFSKIMKDARYSIFADNDLNAWKLFLQWRKMKEEAARAETASKARAETDAEADAQADVEAVADPGSVVDLLQNIWFEGYETNRRLTEIGAGVKELVDIMKSFQP